jgi:hypothetical protein
MSQSIAHLRARLSSGSAAILHGTWTLVQDI